MYQRMRHVPQGPLSLRFSGVCPDAGAKVQPTVHQFACSPDAQSGLKIPSNESRINQSRNLTSFFSAGRANKK